MTHLGDEEGELLVRAPSVEGTGFAVRWASGSDVGRHRAVNEDSLLTVPPVFAVADGMGGHAAGDRASAAVATRLAELEGREFLSVEELDAALGRAADDIAELSVGLASGAGTTVAGAAIALVEETACFLVFNIGDSRVYAVGTAELERVTVDHSVVQELVDAGLIAAADAESHPESNVITRAVGFNEAPSPDLWGLPLRDGLRLLVCSDGLTKEVDDTQIATVLAENPAPADAVAALIARALDAGGRDNVSALVLDVVSAPALEGGGSGEDAG